MSGAVHRIRLHGPWDVRPHATAFQPGQMTIPATLRAGGFVGASGRVSFYRRFGRPTNLEAGDRLSLDFNEVCGAAEVWLNGEVLGPLQLAGSFDVTGRLNERNQLEVIVECNSDECGIVGDVTLVIEALTPPPAPTSQSSPSNESSSD
jgi:hypothetical protein